MMSVSGTPDAANPADNLAKANPAANPAKANPESAPLAAPLAPRLIIVYWRDIPAQIIAEHGRGRRRETVRVELTSRFAEAIDAAAMRAGVTESDAYLEGWRRSDAVDCPDMLPDAHTHTDMGMGTGTLNDAAQRAAARLEAAYDSTRLRMLIHRGGVYLSERADIPGGADIPESRDSGQPAPQIKGAQPSL